MARSLDMIHKNIGATVALLKGIHTLTDGQELPEALAELFIVEADECNYRTIPDGNCSHITEEQLHDSDYVHQRKKCMIANCPLGDLTKPDLEAAANSIDLTGGEII